MVDTSGRKWIAREVAKLDPYKDYAEIIRIMTIYRSNDVFMDFIYAITFPNFITGNHGAEVIFREGKGKAIRHMERRMDQTSQHILIWCEYGPDHPNTLQSIESLNMVHKFWSKHYPDGFNVDEDYTYVICYEATLFHRLLQRAGAKGFSEKEKTASFEFYRRIAPHFRNVVEDRPIEFSMKNFDECMRYAEQYEAQRRPKNQHLELIDKFLISSFARRRFPKLLQPLARSLVITLLPEGTARQLELKRPSRFVQALCRFGFRTFIWTGEHIVPDPKVSMPELARQRGGLTEEQYLAQVVGGMKAQPKAEAGRLSVGPEAIAS
ncbi:oxygenase MpaB family protein [Rhizobium skierniewicense]|uniref:oxygenase MpaB family protein n=1 Tax=Rhizobium skierniewicense TaxID=984260 RepID=UPI001573D703|nr:oxygenase MpaB family protein [Rhizobium skierniewicense]NTF34229.1 DUF2236 domain-containing protein [Rhizobium skierniewicense]